MKKIIAGLMIGLGFSALAYAVTPTSSSPSSKGETISPDKNTQQPLTTDPATGEADVDNLGHGSGDDVDSSNDDTDNDPDPEAEDTSGSSVKS
jgi:hypothetical protein